MRDRSRVAALALVLSVAACHGKSKLDLHDTEGRTFSADCDKAGNCALAQQGGPAAPGGKGVAVLRAAANLVGVCNVASAGDKPELADCRVLVCKKDEDCPPAHDLTHGSCIDDHCREPAHALGVEDAVMLCLAGTGLGRTTPKQVERYAMALNCGSPCRVPTPCEPP